MRLAVFPRFMSDNDAPYYGPFQWGPAWIIYGRYDNFFFFSLSLSLSLSQGRPWVLYGQFKKSRWMQMLIFLRATGDGKRASGNPKIIKLF
jgi:hypothetical protein